MTSPMPPRRRDTRNRDDLIRQDRVRLGQLDAGLVGGRFPPARPLKLHTDGDDAEDDFDAPAVLWEWNDRLTVTTAGRQTFQLSHVPLDESLTIHWHPDGKGALKQINERWLLSGQTVTILDADGDIKAGDVFSAQYQYEDGDESAGGTTDLSSLVCRGANRVIQAGVLEMPAGTQVGDLMVVGMATMEYTGAPGGGVIDDPRLTRLSHCAWVGVVTSLGPVGVTNTGSGADRITAAIATFAAPAAYKNSATTGPAGSTASPMPAPTVDATAAVLVTTTESPNGLSWETTSVPSGYTAAYDMPAGDQVTTVSIWYWCDPDSTTGPPTAGGIGFVEHSSGQAWATVVGLQEGS